LSAQAGPTSATRFAPWRKCLGARLYDATGQLTADGGQGYSYDANGNRTNSGYVTGTDNELLSDGTWNYTYDSEGNLTGKTRISDGLTWAYGYDNLNRMTSAVERAAGGALLEQVTYVYDVFGNRIEEDVYTPLGGTAVTRFAYDGGEVWADLNDNDALQTRYLHGDAVDQLFARISAGGTAGWYLTDRQGSVRDVTDATGVVQDHIDYDGFGNVVSETNPASATATSTPAASLTRRRGCSTTGRATTTPRPGAGRARTRWGSTPGTATCTDTSATPRRTGPIPAAWMSSAISVRWKDGTIHSTTP
jgi:hypothetical protein